MITLFIEGPDSCKNTELRKKLQEFLADAPLLRIEVIQIASQDSDSDKLAKRGSAYCDKKIEEISNIYNTYGNAFTKAYITEQLAKIEAPLTKKPWWKFWRLS